MTDQDGIHKINVLKSEEYDKKNHYSTERLNLTKQNMQENQEERGRLLEKEEDVVRFWTNDLDKSKRSKYNP